MQPSHFRPLSSVPPICCYQSQQNPIFPSLFLCELGSLFTVFQCQLLRFIASFFALTTLGEKGSEFENYKFLKSSKYLKNLIL